MTADSTESSRRRESRRIMREQKNMQQVDGNTHSDQTPGSGPSSASEKTSPSPAKKRRRIDSSTSASAVRPPTLSPYVALKPLDASVTSNGTRNSNQQGGSSGSGQASMYEEVDVTLRTLASRKEELETMKEAITQQRGEVRKKDAAVEDLKAIVEGLKRTVDELRDAAEAMQSRGRELEATIDRLRLENSTQEMELAKLRLHADALQQEKAKALEDQDSLRGKLAKLERDPQSSAATPAQAMSSSDPGQEGNTSPAPESEPEPGASRDKEITEEIKQKSNEEWEQERERSMNYAEGLLKEIYDLRAQLGESRKKEKELWHAHEGVLKDQEDLKKTLSDTLLTHYEIFARQTPKALGLSDSQSDTPVGEVIPIPEPSVPIPEQNSLIPVENAPIQGGVPIPEGDAAVLGENAPVLGDVPMENGGTEPAAISAREVQALEKVKQYKAHNVELKIARDVMRKKLMEVAAARAELETMLTQTRTDLAESQKMLAESQGSYAAIKKTLFESDATLSRCRSALTKANQDLSKAQERAHQVGAYAESWKSTCVSERESSAHLLSQLTVAGTAIKDAFQKTERPQSIGDTSIANQHQTSLNVKSAIYTLMAIVNAEINRRVGAGQHKDWVGLQTIGHSTGTYTGTIPSSLSVTTTPPLIQIPTSVPPAPQITGNEGSHVAG